jgi:hypothetical protein
MLKDGAFRSPAPLAFGVQTQSIALPSVYPVHNRDRFPALLEEWIDSLTLPTKSFQQSIVRGILVGQ